MKALHCDSEPHPIHYMLERMGCFALHKPSHLAYHSPLIGLHSAAVPPASGINSPQNIARISQKVFLESP